MTPAEIKQARQALGLSAIEFARALRFSSASEQGLRNRTSEIETGRNPIDAARAELLRAYLSGYRPNDWPLPADSGHATMAQ